MNRRLHREYLINKQNEQQETIISHHKKLLKHHITNHTPLPTSLKTKAPALLQEILYTIDNTSNKILKSIITTSHKPTNTLKKFAKRLSYILSSRVLNRGSLTKDDLNDYMLRSEYNMLIVVNEANGSANNISFYEYPYGNSFLFELCNVKMNSCRIKGENAYFLADCLDEANGKEKVMVKNVFARLFYVDDCGSGKVVKCKRTVLMAYRNGLICFRHLMDGEENMEGFDMKLYEIVRGTLEGGEKEWVYRPYLNTNRKKE